MSIADVSTLDNKQRAILRAILLNSFLYYLKFSFFQKYRRKIILKPFHLDIINLLLDVYTSKIKKLIINIPPRCGKTEIITIFLEWTLTKHPQSLNIITSYSQDLVLTNSQKIRDFIDSEEHSKVFDIKLKKDSKSKKKWDTVDKGGVYAVSSFGQITGFGAGIFGVDGWTGCIVIDDPLKPSDKDSLLKLDKIKEWYQSTLSNRVNSTDVPTIIIMQRIHTSDLVGCILNNDFEDKDEWTIYNPPFVDEDKKTTLWEDKYPYDKLMSVKKSNPFYYNSQFQQKPIIFGGNLFKTDKLKVVSSRVISQIKFDKIFITADTALKNKQHNDYTVLSCFGVFENKLYLIDMYRGKPIGAELEAIAIAFYRKNNKYPFRGMHIESKASGTNLFQRMSGEFQVYEVERNTDKVLRANDILGYYDTFGLKISDSIADYIDIYTEMEHFPNARHDDIVDTIVDGFSICYNNSSSFELLI